MKRFGVLKAIVGHSFSIKMKLHGIPEFKVGFLLNQEF